MAKPEIFDDLFASNGTSYKVPEYQRAYAWREKQLNQFLTDLREQPEKKDYYLGHFLFESSESDKRQLYVIDGQQRMTTVLVFFSCLIQELKERAKQGEELIDQDNLPVDFRQWEERYFVNRTVRRFRTVEADDDYFERAFVRRLPDVVPSAARRSQKRLHDAGQLIKRALTAEPKPNTATLLRWANLLTTAAVTRFEEPDKVRATQIFAFQNDRGIDLTTLEKLKAYLMYRAYLDDSTAEVKHTIGHVERTFASIYTTIETISLNEDTVLYYHNIAFGNRSKDAFDHVKQQLNAAGADERAHWIKDFCDSLNRSFDTVKEIETLANGYSFATGLLFMQAEHNWPLMLKIQRRHPTDETLREELFRLMEITSFKMEFTTGRYQSNGFHWLASEYNGNIEWLRDKLRECARGGFQPYWAFTQNFHDKLNGNYHYDKVTRYLLWQYENELRRNSPNSKPEPGATFRGMWRVAKWQNTLDHIMPQRPEEMAHSAEFEEKFLHNLGNLALLMRGPNARKNNTLPQEYPEIFNQATNLADREIDQMIAASGNWGEQEILVRKERIVQFAKKFWSLPAE